MSLVSEMEPPPAHEPAMAANGCAAPGLAAASTNAASGSLSGVTSASADSPSAAAGHIANATIKAAEPRIFSVMESPYAPKNCPDVMSQPGRRNLVQNLALVH